MAEMEAFTSERLIQPHDAGAWLGMIQIGIALGFLGAFVLVYLIFSRIFPSLPLPVRD